MQSVQTIAVAMPSFVRGHIPGAMPLAPDPTSAEIASLRLDRDKLIVLYQGVGYPIAAAQAFIALDAAGFGSRTAILDGGLAAWLAIGGALATGPPAPGPGVTTVAPQRGVTVNREFVAAHRNDPKWLVLDARTPDFFRGDTAEPGEPAGHIPRATNLPFTALAARDGTWRPPAEMARAFRLAGFRPGLHLIVYCHSGRKAAVAYFAARLLGYPADLYVGSWRDWTSSPITE